MVDSGEQDRRVLIEQWSQHECEAGRSGIEGGDDEGEPLDVTHMMDTRAGPKVYPMLEEAQVKVG
jgi:hypothetical protein